MSRRSLVNMFRHATIAWVAPAAVLAGCAGGGPAESRDMRTHAETGSVTSRSSPAAPTRTQVAPNSSSQGASVATNDPGVELYETPSGKKLPALSTIKFPSGVVATDLVFGTGATALPGSVIKVHYLGTLPDGKVFDSTRGGEPVEFPLNQLIAGWREGIPGMMVGGVRRLLVPAKEAYGEEGAPPDIPPRTDLVFTIELVEVVEKK